jgi:regulator of extracellular matrix RemA (YlzA/DUF370 family)
MKMKKQTVITLIIISVILIGIGVKLGEVLAPVHECTRKHQNIIPDGRIVIIPVDTVEGRPVFDVIISDENVVEAMYPEEIANSLNSGKWEYNEMLEIKEKAE